jgi:hypothetical protein
MNGCVEHHREQRAYCPYCVIEHYTWVNKKQKDRIKKLAKELATYKAVEEMAELRQNDKNF